MWYEVISSCRFCNSHNILRGLDNTGEKAEEKSIHAWVLFFSDHRLLSLLVITYPFLGKHDQGIL